MFVEDLIEKLCAHRKKLTEREKKFVFSLARHTERGNALTSRQGWAILKLLRESSFHQLLGIERYAYDEFLREPKWRKPLVPSVPIMEEVRYLGDNLLGFRTSRSIKSQPHFDRLEARYSYGMTVVNIDSPSRLAKTIDTIGTLGFARDAATDDWLAEALDCVDLPACATATADQIVIDVPDDNTLAQWVHHILGANPL